jgi:hypothetical protein
MQVANRERGAGTHGDLVRQGSGGEGNLDGAAVLVLCQLQWQRQLWQRSAAQ